MYLLACMAYLAGCAAPPQPTPPTPRPAEPAGPLIRLERSLPTVRPAHPHPHVVLVIACTVRRDQVSAYANDVGSTTPFLEELARRGVRFADPIVAAPWTRASAAALLTGRHAVELGIVERDRRRNDRALPQDAVTLAERFHRAGYRTIGGTTNPNLNAVFGFDQGFEVYYEPAMLWREGSSKIPGTVLIDALLEELPPPGERPLYLQAVFVEAHAPRTDDPSGPDELPFEVRRYRGALSALDATIRNLHERLRAMGYGPDRTLFVVVNDHGEGLLWPQHHGRGHGRYLYGSSVEGVWLMAGPGLPAGVTLPGVSSHVDVGRTVLTAAGIPSDAPGMDHGPRLEKPGPSPREFAVVNTWFWRSNRGAIYTDRRACMKSYKEGHEPPARTGRFVPGCYDRLDDPLQEHPSPAPDVALLAALDRWRAEHDDGASAMTVSVERPLAEQLEALGYTE